MSCGKSGAELLSAYTEAEERLKEAMPKAHAFIPGEPLKAEWMDEERIERIDRLETGRDNAQRAWRQHL